MTQTTLSVNEMSCGKCEKRVVKALMATPGVQEATADRESNSATITHDDSVNASALAQIVSDAGYPASTP